MTTAMIATLAVASVMQRDSQWRTACCLFAAITLSFDLWCSGLPGEVYYLAAAATDSVCAAMLRRMRGSFPLVVLCLVSCVLNFSGWCLYEFYFSPDLYDGAFIIFYVASAAVILGGGPNNARFANYWGVPSVLRGAP